MSSWRMVKNDAAAASWISAPAPFKTSWVTQTGQVTCKTHLYIAPVILWPYSDVLEVQCDRGNLPELLVPLYEMFQLDSVERDSGGYWWHWPSAPPDQHWGAEGRQRGCRVDIEGETEGRERGRKRGDRMSSQNVSRSERCGLVYGSCFALFSFSFYCCYYCWNTTNYCYLF